MLSRVKSISAFTAADELHNRSFFVFMAVCVLLVLSIRGCYKSEYVVNGQKLDGLSVAWHTSVIAYHTIAVFGLFMSMVLSSRALRRDKENGSTVFCLSAPVSRLEYAAGKILGIWIIAFSFMFILHSAVFVMTLTVSKGMLPWLPVASAAFGLNLLFAICLFMLLSIFFNELIAMVTGIAVLGVSFISDGIHAAMHTGIAVQAFGSQPASHITFWRMAWPKSAALQFYGANLIQNNTFSQMGPVHPVFNILIWTVILFCVLAWKMQHEEI
jgi:ABC-type transport system involved in multi-copper enzyme maturation permease subunit